MKTSRLAPWTMALGAVMALICHCKAASNSDCSGDAPTLQCESCGGSVAKTGVCVDGQWSCGPAPPCAPIGTQTCGQELCFPGGSYCAATTDGGGACTAYPLACEASQSTGCKCIAFDDASCACSEDDAGVTLMCSGDVADASDAAATD